MNGGRVGRFLSFLSAERSGEPGLAIDLGLTLAIIALVTMLDYATGVQLSFSLFYLVPVSLMSWRRGLWFGLGFALFCALLRFAVDKVGGREYAHLYIAYWNTGVRLGVLLVTAVLVSKLRRAIRAADAARDAALAASRAKSDFLSSMSHEIRTPLSAILAMADALAETRLDPSQADYVKLFRQEGKRLLALLSDLLDSSKIEAGGFTAQKSAFALNGLLAEIGSIVGSQTRAKGLDFSMELAPELPARIVGDSLLLRRTILNLTANAVKFTTTGSISLKAGLDPAEPGNSLAFSVADTGIGIPQEALGRLFLPFSQADASIGRDFGGTGLGLSLCKSFVELMGGRIWATSQAGKGSVFSFTIPLEQAPAEDGAGTAEPDEAPPVLAWPVRILLVEDYEANRAIARTFLKDTPYQIDEAVNGRIGTGMFGSSTYDLVLMDVQMPVMDGYEAAGAIRKLELETGRRRTPIIALTAHASEEELRRTTRAGFDAHIIKPYTKTRLLGTIAAVLEGRDGGPAPRDGGSASAAEAGTHGPDIADIVPVFLGDLGKMLAEARDELGRGGYGALGSIGHRLKGSGSMFGFDLVSGLGAELEASAARKDDEAVQAILRELESFSEKEGSHVDRKRRS
jgi:signal transduction histidine kinase/CheY-like chemotaxis protein/HPt (histidine-containing phosphotransfer) domain-containing protein